MNVSSLLSIFQTMLETAAIVRAQYVAARAYGDLQGMTQAIETSISIDEDVVSLLEGTPFQPLRLSARDKVPGTPEEILELMRTLKRLESANISSLLRSIPGEIAELEERRQYVARKKMIAVGNYFRVLKRALKEQFHAWSESDEREFSSMLRLGRKKKSSR